MKKIDLVNLIALQSGKSKKGTREMLDAMINIARTELRKGNSIALPGFGTFTVAKRKARKGRNPRTGEEIRIPEMKVAKFKPVKSLKDTIKR